MGVLYLHLHVVSMMRGAFPMHTMTDYTEGPVIGPSSLLYECYVIVTLTHYLSICIRTYDHVLYCQTSHCRLKLPAMTSSVGVNDASLVSN